MFSLTISERTKENLALCVGKPFESIVNLTPEDEMKYISEKTGKKLSFSKERDFRKIGRGNPLLSRKKIRTMSDVEKKVSEDNIVVIITRLRG